MLEIPRLVLVVVIMGIASYHDVRSREIPDYLWIVGGVAGAILYVFDWNEVDSFVVFSIAIGGMLALLTWKIFPMGDADALAVLMVSVAYPVSFGTMINPAVMFFGGLILEHMAAFIYNIRYNVEDLIRHRRVFDGVQCSVLTRMMAFYSVHARRPRERFTFSAECTNGGRREISLRTPSPDSDYETRTGLFVTWAMPAFPFMTTSLILGAVLAYMLL